MTSLRQQATTLLNAIPDEKLLPIVEYMQHVHDISTVRKSRRHIDLNQYAGSAKDVFGKGVDVEDYINEERMKQE